MAVRKRTPIDRRFATEATQTAAVDSIAPADTIIFVDAWGNPDQRFDSGQLAGLPVDLRDLLVEAFRAHCVAQQSATRQTTWRALRRFTCFVVDDGMIETASDLDTAALGRYVLWLKKQGASRAPRGAHAIAFDLLRPLLFWCLRNRRGRIAHDLEIPWNAFPGRRASQQPRRSEERRVGKECRSRWSPYH